MKTSFIPCYNKISFDLPKVGVLSCECRNFSCVVGVVCEACHSLEFDAPYLNLQPHFIHIFGTHASFGWIPTLWSPRFGRNPNQLIGSQSYRLPIWSASRGGRPVVLYTWLCYCRTWEHMKTNFIPCYHKISSGLPKVGVLSCECRNFSFGVGVVCEACHTLEFHDSSLNLQPPF